MRRRPSTATHMLPSNSTQAQGYTLNQLAAWSEQQEQAQGPCIHGIPQHWPCRRSVEPSGRAAGCGSGFRLRIRRQGDLPKLQWLCWKKSAARSLRWHRTEDPRTSARLISSAIEKHYAQHGTESLAETHDTRRLPDAPQGPQATPGRVSRVLIGLLAGAILKRRWPRTPGPWDSQSGTG